MESPTHEANGNSKDRNDLTQIRGIGAVRKRWLNSFGIDTIADLAQASADAIEAQAKSDGRTLSREELEAWLAQAQVHHVKASLEQADSFEAIAETVQANSIEDHTEIACEQPLPDWNSIASFKVDYQSRWVNGKAEQRITAHHLETDAIESWSTFETDWIQQWLHDRVEMALPLLQTENSIVAESTVAESIVAEITQLRVMQPYYMKVPMVADRNSPIFSNAIQTDQPFALEVSIQFAGLTQANQHKQIAYRVQCFARNLATGVTDSLEDVTAHSLSDDSAYTILLPSLRLRQSGTYRLKVLVTLPQAPAALGQFKVPMLQVV
ncbi:MAG: hypothetical protein KME42_03965 [Tildeniella nuda ZEHNDER 1965/U140]|nr:hypothetical protein [Tildeniella nuda ZEHNDER 1965/U140]